MDKRKLLSKEFNRKYYYYKLEKTVLCNCFLSYLCNCTNIMYLYLLFIFPGIVWYTSWCAHIKWRTFSGESIWWNCEAYHSQTNCWEGSATFKGSHKKRGYANFFWNYFPRKIEYKHKRLIEKLIAKQMMGQFWCVYTNLRKWKVGDATPNAMKRENAYIKQRNVWRNCIISWNKSY